MKFKLLPNGRVNIPDEFLNFLPVYYDENPEGRPTTSFDIPSGDVLTTIITRPVVAPEGFGAIIRATIRAVNSSGGADDCFWDVSLDGTIVRAHGFNIAASPFNSEGSLQAVVRELVPGNRVFTMNAQSNGGIGVIAEMTVELVHASRLMVNSR